MTLIRTIAAFYAQGRRYLKIAGHYGEQFHPGNGIGQGDPLSMRFVNGAGWIWIRMMKVNFADTRLGVYVDDRSIRAKDRSTMQRAIAKTAKLDETMGQELNITKTYGLATTLRARRRLRGLRIGTTKLVVVNEARNLGAQVTTMRRKVHTMARQRIHKARATIKKIARNYIPLNAKRTMVGAAGMAKGIFGASVTALPRPQVSKLRTSIIQACLGHKKPHAAPELVTTMLLEPTRHDPLIAADYEAVNIFKRLIGRDQGVVHTVDKLLAHYADEESNVTGPVARLKQIMESCNHVLHQGMLVYSKGGAEAGPVLDLLRRTGSSIKQFMIDNLRARELRNLAKRCARGQGQFSEPPRARVLVPEQCEDPEPEEVEMPPEIQESLTMAIAAGTGSKRGAI